MGQLDPVLRAIVAEDFATAATVMLKQQSGEQQGTEVHSTCAFHGTATLRKNMVNSWLHPEHIVESSSSTHTYPFCIATRRQLQ